MKFLDPKFVTGIITMLAITLNNKFMWNLNEIQLTASIGAAVSFILAQLAVDIKKGKPASFNSTKFVTMIIACLLIGFTNYVGINLDTESILWITGVAVAFILGKGGYDVAMPRKGVTSSVDYNKADSIGE